MIEYSYSIHIPILYVYFSNPVILGPSSTQAVANRDCPDQGLQPWRGAEILCGRLDAGG